MNPSDNLELAKFLHKRPKGPPEEATIRGACGRAYYAAFGAARDVLMAVPFRFAGTDEDHRRVVTLLKLSANQDVATAGSLLDQLRSTRNSADYDVGSVPVRGAPFEPRRSQMALVLAAGVIDGVERVQKVDRRLYIPPTVS